MRVRLLILLLLSCGTAANADDGKELTGDSKSKKGGDTIWLEEKISPTTVWLENLVKPLTIWMEQQINEPEQVFVDKAVDQVSNDDLDVRLIEVDPVNVKENTVAITSEQASDLAKDHIAGDVLYIKLLSKTNQYRVKLISKVGEIHIIYIQAASGDVVTPNNKMVIEPAKQLRIEQENRSKLETDAEYHNADGGAL